MFYWILAALVLSALGGAVAWARQSGVDSEKKKQAVRDTVDAEKLAKRWANRPRDRESAIERLRHIARKRR